MGYFSLSQRAPPIYPALLPRVAFDPQAGAFNPWKDNVPISPFESLLAMSLLYVSSKPLPYIGGFVNNAMDKAV